MADLDGLVPNPLTSDKQYARFYHLDLCDLEDMELTDELHALRVLLWGLPPNHWLRERINRLGEEIRKRRCNIRYELGGHPRPKLAKGVKL